MRSCNTIHKIVGIVALASFFLWALAFASARPASAQGWVSGFTLAQNAPAAPALPAAPGPGLGCTAAPLSTWLDPQGFLKETSIGWLAPAQSIAGKLLQALLVFEVFILGLQAILFHQNLQQLLASLAFKTLTACFFIYLIAHAGSLFPSILGSFQIAGQSLGSGSTNILSIFAQGTNVAALFFCAAMSSHEGDLQSETVQIDPLTICGRFNVGSGNMACSVGAGIGHITFEFYVQILGILIIVAMGIIFLSLVMLMSEAYIVMFAGALFLGFATSRFTMPFAQGYLSYMVNVGARLFTFWIVVAIEQVLLMPMLQSTGKDLIQAGAIKFGLGAEMLLAPASIAVAQIMAMAALTWFLPKTVGKFVSGRSPLSSLKSISQSLSSSPQVAAASIGVSGGGNAAPAISHRSMQAKSLQQSSETIRRSDMEPTLSMSAPAAERSASATPSISSPGFSSDLIRPSSRSTTPPAP